MGQQEAELLEADPYWDQSTIPINTFKNKAPFTSKVVSTKRIVGAQATGETCHIILDHQGKMPYWEGQSYGVIPPGVNPKNGKPNSVRLYSIASSRYGDDMTGTTTSLCVRRATYWCPELKADDPAKKGVCSNFLCDSKPGDDVKLTGPSGKVMLIPEKEADVDLVMVDGHGHRAVPLVHPPPLRREDAVRRGVQGPRVALPRRGQLGRAPLRRRVADGPQGEPGQLPPRLRALARADQRGRRQDVHPGQGQGVLR